jgi:hypothetical protein
MGPGGTPVVMRLGEAIVVVSGHGMVVRVADGKVLGQVKLPAPSGEKGGDYSATYGSWTAWGDVLLAAHFRGWLYAIRLSIEGDALRQELLWRSAARGDNRNANLIVEGPAHRLYAGPLSQSVPGSKRGKRLGYCILDTRSGEVVRSGGKGGSGYNTAIGFAGGLLVYRSGGWNKDAARSTRFTVQSVPDFALRSEALLAPPRPAGEVAARHVATLGSPYIVWGPAGVSCWGNRIFIRSNDYLWCIGDPAKPFAPPGKGAQP